MTGMFDDSHSHNKPALSKSDAKRLAQKERGKNTPTSRQVEIDWEQAKKLCALFCTCSEVAAFFEISAETLRYRIITEGLAGSWKEFFEMYSAPGKMSLRREQFLKATQGKDTRMLIWLGKQYLNQAEKQIVITEDLGDGPKQEYNIDDIPTEDLEKMEEILSKVEVKNIAEEYGRDSD